MDLVELMARRSAWAPKTCRMTRVSLASFCGVDVPWAFT